MAVPDAAVTFLLENLSQVLVSNYDLVSDVRVNIESLKGELLSLKNMMEDFQRYNNDSLYVDQTMQDIRNILDEAEDVVDSYILQASVHKLRGFLSKAFHHMTKYPVAIREVSKQIELLSARVKTINDVNVEKGLKMIEYQAERRHKNPKQAEAPQVEEENVIGFDKAAETVEKLLVGGVEKLEVVSIVGMLGLGKTTLAKKVYKDPHVDYEYMIRAFVYVSREYEKKEVLLSILNSFSKASGEVNSMTEQQLEKHLYKELEGKQYLIVLDDVWEKEDWDKLKAAFPNNKKRCRVLITTRNAKVAEHANRDPDSLYKLDFLPLPDSRKLLLWRVFRQEKLDDTHKELESYEIKIAAKCAGLPLAIVVIAGILVNQPNRVDWWSKVADSVKDYIARDAEQTATVIELMYKHLPNYLKPCFLYLGVFREDSEIKVWKLMRLWISEGFIPQEGDINLEESAELYLNELVQRNLVMVGKTRKNERIKTCRMHDTLREFCKKEAAKDNIFHEIKKNKLSSDLLPWDTYRRICNNNPNILDYISGELKGKRVRSFLTFVKDDTAVEAKHVSCIPKAFKLLRVLETQSLIFARFPSDLCNLVLLKYVAISSTFSTLPAAMSSLWNLQTLIVMTNSRTLDIKADLWKMPQFRHLHTNASATLPTTSTSSKIQKNKPSQFSNSNIQTLSTISPESCTLELFDRAPKVKKFGISGALADLFTVNNAPSFFSQLRRLESLENLKLLNDDSPTKIYSLPKDYPGRLTKLTLMNTRLEWKEMAALAQLKSLEILKLKEFAFQGYLWNTEKGGFESLTHLFVGQTDVVVWEASKDHFPKLKGLELNGCDKLQAFPHGLADIPSLQMVVLHCTNPVVASSARRLQVLKLEQAKKGNDNSFKLHVYPPGH